MIVKHISAAIAFFLAAVTCGLGSSAQARDEVSPFTEANVLSILYHELGHALIHVLGLPVFGQEEDAADVLSVVLLNELFEEEAAVELAYAAAFGFHMEAERGQPVFWDTHGPDLQRFYTLVCLFYGAAPDEREDVAQELGLPEDRAKSCEEEYELAYDSWGAVLDEISEKAPGKSLVFEGARDSALARLVADEVEALNKDFVLPEQLAIRVEPCGEANAFYDLDEVSITMCSELADHLAKMEAELN